MAQTLEDRLRERLSSAVKQASVEMSSNVMTGYLVKRLIVEGTFRNTFATDGTVEGFEVKVKNRIGVATVVGATPLKIDGEVFGVELVSIVKNRIEMKASEISESNPIAVGFGDEMLIKIADDQGLESGKHRVELGLKMVGLGLIEAQFEEKLAGDGRQRVRKAEPVGADGDDFAAIMRRTIESAAEKVGTRSLAECAKVVSGIVLDLSDEGGRYSVKIGADGSAEFVEGAVSGGSVLTIRTTRAVFHNMAHGRINAGMAYAKGDVRLEGVPILKLRGMDGVITAIFEAYRAASEGVEYETAAGAGGAGMIEEIFGVVFMVFDEVMKALDKALSIFGVNYFYEKSLNRMELVWNVLDREMRKRLDFGREEESADGAPDASVAEEQTAPKPAPAGKSLQDRLRERIQSAVESAVQEVTRSTVSGYLVKRLIEPGSFRNYGSDGAIEGFEVKLKNRLGAATVIGFTDIKVDGETYDLSRIEITKKGTKLPASAVSQSRPLSVAFGDELLIRVGKPGGIAAGSHRVSLGVNMVGLGGVDVDYEEKLSA